MTGPRAPRYARRALLAVLGAVAAGAAVAASFPLTGVTLWQWALLAVAAGANGMLVAAPPGSNENGSSTKNGDAKIKEFGSVTLFGAPIFGRSRSYRF